MDKNSRKQEGRYFISLLFLFHHSFCTHIFDVVCVKHKVSLREYDSYRYIATVRYRIDGTVRTALRLYTTYTGAIYKYNSMQVRYSGRYTEQLQ